VVVSKKEWENLKQQLEKLKNSLLPATAAAAEPSLPPRPVVAAFLALCRS